MKAVTEYITAWHNLQSKGKCPQNTSPLDTHIIESARILKYELWEVQE
jgi:hypothetical protein